MCTIQYSLFIMAVRCIFFEVNITKTWRRNDVSDKILREKVNNFFKLAVS